MNSIKELKEQLGYEEIGLDDTFTFHCTQCGKCCIHREDILLSPKDLFNIAKKFQITPAEALEQYCETYIGCNSRFPIVRLRPQGSVKRCPLLKDQKCLVHDVNRLSVPCFRLVGILPFLRMIVFRKIQKNCLLDISLIILSAETESKHIPSGNGFVVLTFH